MTPPDLNWEVVISDPMRVFDDWDIADFVAESVPRNSVGQINQNLVSGTLMLIGGIVIPAGKGVTGINFLLGTTAVAAPTNQWGCIVDRDTLIPLGVTEDRLAEAWAASTRKRFAMNPALPPSGRNRFVYVGLVVVGATAGSVQGQGNRFATTGLAPVLGGGSSAGLVGPGTLPSPVAAPASIQCSPWVCLDNA